MGRPTKLTITQQQQVVSMYIDEKLSTNKISKKFEVNPETIRGVLIKNNVIMRPAGETNKASTHFTFSTLTEEKSFLLGLIYGDGSISNRQDYINITSGDLDLLEKSQKILGNKFKITKVKDSNCWRGVIYSHKLCDELLELFNLANNKSDKLVWPDIEYTQHFISGYLATDGSIGINKKDNLLTVSFYSCSKLFLDQLNKYLCEMTAQKLRTIYRRDNLKGHLGTKPLYTLVFNGIKAEKICQYIFTPTTPNTRGDRKFHIYQEFMKTKQLS